MLMDSGAARAKPVHRRILSRIRCGVMVQRSPGELLLEDYLAARGLQLQIEPRVGRRNPDFVVEIDDAMVGMEVYEPDRGSSPGWMSSWRAERPHAPLDPRPVSQQPLFRQGGRQQGYTRGPALHCAFAPRPRRGESLPSDTIDHQTRRPN